MQGLRCPKSLTPNPQWQCPLETSQVDPVHWLRCCVRNTRIEQTAVTSARQSAKSRLLSLALPLSTPGRWGWEPGRDGGGDPAEEAQTQEASGQGAVVVEQRGRRLLQGQEEETRPPADRQAPPQPAQTHQADEHHHRHGHQLQGWVSALNRQQTRHFLMKRNAPPAFLKALFRVPSVCSASGLLVTVFLK